MPNCACAARSDDQGGGHTPHRTCLESLAGHLICTCILCTTCPATRVSVYQDPRNGTRTQPVAAGAVESAEVVSGSSACPAEVDIGADWRADLVLARLASSISQAMPSSVRVGLKSKTNPIPRNERSKYPQGRGVWASSPSSFGPDAARQNIHFDPASWESLPLGEVELAVGSLSALKCLYPHRTGSIILPLFRSSQLRPETASVKRHDSPVEPALDGAVPAELEM